MERCPKPPMRECTNDTNPEKQDFHLRTLSFVKQTSPLGTMHRVAEHAFPGSKRKYRQKTLYIEKNSKPNSEKSPKKRIKIQNHSTKTTHTDICKAKRPCSPSFSQPKRKIYYRWQSVKKANCISSLLKNEIPHTQKQKAFAKNTENSAFYLPLCALYIIFARKTNQKSKVLAPSPL